MAAFNFFNIFKLALPEKIHNLSTDNLRVAFTAAAPSAAATEISELSEISYSNLSGNPTSRDLVVTSSMLVGDTYRLMVDNLELVCTSNYFGPFRYLVIYSVTATSNDLIGWIDYGQSKRLSTGEIFNITFDQINGLFKIRS